MAVYILSVLLALALGLAGVFARKYHQIALQIKQNESEKQGEINALKMAHQSEIEALKVAKESELNALKTAAQNEIEALKTAQIYEVEKLKLAHQNELQSELHNLRHALENQKNKLATELEIERSKTAQDEEIRQKMSAIFTNLSQEILDKKTQAFSENQAKTLEPFVSEIKNFKGEFMRLKEAQIAEQGALKNELSNLKSMNEQVSREAQNLANALKNQSKIRGNWGEMLLEKLLENNGMRENEHYRKQVSLFGENDAGEVARYHPDIVLDLPQNRSVVIDSKLNLIAYLALAESEEGDKEARAAELNRALNAHIKELKNKKYHDLLGGRSLEFSIMFIPLEGVFSEAMRYQNGEIFNRAFEAKVVLASPSTLVAILMIIKNLWRHEELDKNYFSIVEKLGKISKKLDSAREHFNSLGNAIGSLTRHYGSAEKALFSGNANLAKQIEGALKDTSKQAVIELEEDDALDDSNKDGLLE